MKLIKKHLVAGTENKIRARGQVASANGWLKHAKSFHLRQSLDLDKLKELVS